jgi:hypothetical protein
MATGQEKIGLMGGNFKNSVEGNAPTGYHAAEIEGRNEYFKMECLFSTLYFFCKQSDNSRRAGAPDFPPYIYTVDFHVSDAASG